MYISENYPITQLTSIHIGGPARYVIRVEEIGDVIKAYDFAEEKGLPVWIMGGGANTIGHDEGFEGVILLNVLRGITVRSGRLAMDYLEAEVRKSELSESILLTGGGGVEWDDFVDVACRMGYSGIEAMSAIPGAVGAAPVQNIGAYGQDIAAVIEKVEAYDSKERKFVTLNRDEMNMGYRSTRFNSGEDAGRFFIASVTVKLNKTQLKPPFYNSLQRYIDEHNETDFSPMNIRKMVSAIREDKLPDVELKASAGSFFKNVYLDKAGADKAEAKGIPLWRDENGGGKINSGWLIEACGLKGKKIHGFRVSEKAALILINEDHGSYADLAKARREIIDTVKDKFGYTLEQEPVEIPVEQKME